MRAWAFIGIGILMSAFSRVVEPSADWTERLPFTVLYVVAATGVYQYLIDKIETRR